MGRWELISKGLILEIYFFCKGDGPITGGRGGGVYRWRAYKTRFTVADHSNLLGIVYSLQAMYKERHRALNKSRLYLLQQCQRSRGKNS